MATHTEEHTAGERGRSDGFGPWPLDTRGALRLFVWPCYDDASELARLAQAVAPIARDTGVALVARHDARVDGDRESALEALLVVLAECHGAEAELEVLVEDHPFELEDLERLGAAVQGVLDLGGRDRFDLARLKHVPLRSAADVAAWRERHARGGALPALVRDALGALSAGTAMWFGGPSPRAAAEVADALGQGARLVVAAPWPQAREARAQLFATAASARIDWIDLSAPLLASVWDEPIELLVLDGRRGAPALRRTFENWSAHLVPGAHVVIVEDAGDGRRMLAGLGLLLRAESGGVALLVAGQSPRRAAN